jgi:WD40 repeat protein
MKHSTALLLCLLLPTIVISQSNPILERRSNFEFGDAQERVVAFKFVGGENKLVLVGNKVVRVLDVTNAKVLSSRPLDVPEFNEDRPREISPDGRRMIVFGNYSSRKKEDKIRQPPSVWDLQTGKQITTLDKTAKPIRAAIWSKNGKTLATSSDQYAPTSPTLPPWKSPSGMARPLDIKTPYRRGKLVSGT